MKHTPNGFSLIELLIVLVILSILAAIAIPNLMAARRNANEASTVSSLRTISSAEVTYRNTVGAGNFGDMSALIDGGLTDSSFSSGTRTGYNLELVKVDASGAQPAIYNISAIPVKFGISTNATGARSYYSNEAGAIYYNFTEVAPYATSNLDRTIINGQPLAN